MAKTQIFDFCIWGTFTSSIHFSGYSEIAVAHAGVSIGFPILFSNAVLHPGNENPPTPSTPTTATASIAVAAGTGGEVDGCKDDGGDGVDGGEGGPGGSRLDG